ncbi:MAG: hypothetical protein A3G76_11925 [Acidobacteria bacterium RIFCSPLOWO2_12_FULL_65_11]|nr:MAG: hypothetical protein A3H95_00485 [Acidobacteria bacterium RIFCSPLOWO2_02_FULL_64_15]OFW33502.1 MAG: hypothetical protein A3G76_11925 [Acidobacteria bacterium RIFCSPLOWO2_12_FULL_65_11]
MIRRGRLTVAGLSVALACASLAGAQQIWISGRVSERVATIEDFDGQFLYCRGIFNGGWRTDYPGADNNFSIRLAELTRIPVKFDPNRQPHHVVVRLDDPVLFHCPMVFMENVESLRGFSEEEATNLRNYLVKGGFLWVDDFWGSNAWANWEDHISSVLPPSEFPIFDLPISHPIMHTVFDVKEFLQVPNINFWYRSGGSVSERGYDSAEVHYRGIQNSRGHLMVLTTHNTDVSDTWEREGAAEEYFNRFSPRGYAIGVNVVVYALTH